MLTGKQCPIYKSPLYTMTLNFQTGQIVAVPNDDAFTAQQETIAMVLAFKLIAEIQQNSKGTK